MRCCYSGDHARLPVTSRRPQATSAALRKRPSRPGSRNSRAERLTLNLQLGYGSPLGPVGRQRFAGPRPRWETIRLVSSATGMKTAGLTSPAADDASEPGPRPHAGEIGARHTGLEVQHQFIALQRTAQAPSSSIRATRRFRSWRRWKNQSDHARLPWRGTSRCRHS